MEFIQSFIDFINRIIDSIKELVRRIREHNDPKLPTEGTEPNVVA